MKIAVESDTSTAACMYTALVCIEDIEDTGMNRDARRVSFPAKFN